MKETIAAYLKRCPTFTRRVLEVVMTIPEGETRSYQWVAQQAGSAHAARAVGQVLKRNPFPIIIPCHRVIAASGALTGYSAPGGLARKAELLAKEKEEQVD